MRQRIREYAIPVLLAAAIAVGLVRVAIETKNNNQANRTITCQSLRNQDNQLKALRSFSDQLGVPWVYPIPEVPPECDGH
jgi:hypothetical protein